MKFLSPLSSLILIFHPFAFRAYLGMFDESNVYSILANKVHSSENGPSNTEMYQTRRKETKVSPIGLYVSFFLSKPL